MNEKGIPYAVNGKTNISSVGEILKHLACGVGVVHFNSNDINVRVSKVNGPKNRKLRALCINAEVMHPLESSFAEERVQSAKGNPKNRCLVLQGGCLVFNSRKMTCIIVLLESGEHTRFPRDCEEVPLPISVGNRNIDISARRAIGNQLCVEVGMRFNVHPRPSALSLKKESVVEHDTIPRANVNKDSPTIPLEDVRFEKFVLLLLTVVHLDALCKNSESCIQMVPWTALLSAVAWVDFLVIVLSKVVPLTKSLATWYADFGLVAIGTDILIIVLGIALAMFLAPGASGLTLIGIAVAIQVLHDVLFYVGVIQMVPFGQNRILDLFKRYAAEGGWRILVADAGMVAGSVWLMETMDAWLTDDQVVWSGLLALYSLMFLLYTK